MTKWSLPESSKSNMSPARGVLSLLYTNITTLVLFLFFKVGFFWTIRVVNKEGKQKWGKTIFDKQQAICSSKFFKTTNKYLTCNKSFKSLFSVRWYWQLGLIIIVPVILLSDSFSKGQCKYKQQRMTHPWQKNKHYNKISWLS